MHAIVPFSLFLLAIIGFGAFALHARRSSIQVDTDELGTLLAALAPVDMHGLACVAREFLEPQRDQIGMEPEIIWRLLGGDLGLKRMRSNADLLLALAALASQWNEQEGAIVAERMRRDALRLRSALRQVKLGMLAQLVTGHHWISVPFQLQEAASSYYLMRQRLLALIEASHVGLLPRVALAV